MLNKMLVRWAVLWLVALPFAWADEPKATLVNVDNFSRAESHKFFSRTVERGGFGTFVHNADLVPVQSQFVIRPNRDTLYSSAVFDLDAGPVSITLPDARNRYLSMIAISEEQYTPGVQYGAGIYTYSREQVGSRYVLVGIRILVDPRNPQDLEQARALQGRVQVSQVGGPGRYVQSNWDQATLESTRKALLALGASLPDSRGMYGSAKTVDPIRHLIGSAAAWGGNPERDALYLNVSPERNDGNTPYRLRIKDVPVDAFWSVSVYNAAGYFERNRQGAYAVNSITSSRDADGSVQVQFGDCTDQSVNCLPIMPGWNYMVRLYKPGAELLDGSWRFPMATPVN